jgi:hypothetical protein
MLAANKAGLMSACAGCLGSAEETTLLTSAQRDTSKDIYAMADGMGNVSLWNLAFERACASGARRGN